VKAAQAQLDALVRGLRDVIADGLAGVYLHGSLVLGCFNPALSDIDLLVVTDRPLEPEKRRILESLLSESGRVELSFLAARSLRRWRHPAPYELHFGGAKGLVGPGVDHDLAAHFTVTRHAGIALLGPPAREIFPHVPWADYEDSLRRDLETCGEHGGGIYAVLSPARIWATLTERKIHSKASGGAWALERAPREFKPLISRALETYESGTSDPRFERNQVRPWARFVIQARERDDDPPPEAGFARREAH
jgi:Domain of unknown function (DUF4111)/Nucleotidyltransferase domain